MAENVKYSNKEMLLKANEELQGSNSLIGMTMLGMPQYNSSMRSIMFTSHERQVVNLLHPDFPAVFTNGENVVGRYSTGYKQAKGNYEVVDKVVKYEDIIDHPTTYTLFVYDKEKKYYEAWSRCDSESLTEVFGYEYNNDYMDGLEVGDEVPKGTVIKKSRSYDDSMNYGYGINVPIMYTTESYTSEDACVISQSLHDRLQSIEINTVSIGVNDNDFLLNLYGKGKKYKPFPDIGEFSTGEVAAKRTLSKEQLLSEFKDDSLTHSGESDVSYYKKGQVVDVTVYCNNPDIEDTPFTHQILKYLKSQRKYYQGIKEACEMVFDSGEKYSKEINYLYKRAIEFLDEDKRWKDQDSLFSNVKIEITVKGVVRADIGQKITGRYGNKSVISDIRPDDEMPFYYDDNGNKVTIDLLFNVLAIINRTTAFPIFEITMNFICNKVRAQMKMRKTRKEREELLFGIIDDFNHKQHDEMKAVYDKLSDKEKDEYIQQVMDDHIYIHQKPMWEDEPIFYRLLKIYEKYDFLTPYDMYINKFGRTIKMLHPMYAGEMYILKLKQTSRKGFSVRSTGSINTKGLPERSYRNKNFTELRSSTPIRFGEFETLNFSIGMDPEDIQIFNLMYRASAKGRRDLANGLITGKDQFKVSKTYTSRVNEIFAVYLKSLGIEVDFIDDEDSIREYDDRHIKIETIDDQDYMGTEYDLMLVKRKKAVEKEVLEKEGIIDADKFKQIVMEELKTNSYVVGPDKSEYDTTPAFQDDTDHMN